jgi:hypothetical protein
MVLEAYRADYATMQEQMIYEEAVSFERLMERLKKLQGRYREVASWKFDRSILP